MKKEGEKMGAFIDQVQKNNMLQAETLTQKQKERQEKEERRQEKEDIKAMQAGCIQELDFALLRIFQNNKKHINGLTALKMIENKNKIIDCIGENYIEKEYLDKIYYRELNKISKQYKMDEEARELVEESNARTEAEKNEKYRQEMQAHYEAKHPTKKTFEKLKETAPKVWKVLNIIANILLFPFIILIVIIGGLVGAGIKENKKNKF